MLLENLNNLNKVTLNQIQHKDLKLSHENQTENEEFIKLMRLNVAIGMKHFIEMIMMTNLAIRTIVVPFKTAVPHRTKSQTKSRYIIGLYTKKNSMRR